jgi:hypothetical protein
LSLAKKERKIQPVADRRGTAAVRTPPRELPMTKIYLSIPMNVNGDEISEMPALLVTLDLDTIKAMILQVRRIQQLHAKDDQIFSMRRHGTTPIAEVYDLGNAYLDSVDLFADGVTELTDQQYGSIKNAIKERGSDSAEIKVDNRREEYLTGGVYFAALMKHTTVELESQGLGLDDLLAYRKRLSKEG